MSIWDTANIVAAIAAVVVTVIALAFLLWWNARKDREMLRDLRAERGLPPNDPKEKRK